MRKRRSREGLGMLGKEQIEREERVLDTLT